VNDREDTLRAFYKGELIFTSNGKWLYPLFELEKHLQAHKFAGEDLYVEDDIVGKASALLICRMGIRKVLAGILSKPGEGVFQNAGVEYDYKQKVERILCQTEDLLAEIDDPEKANIILKERARLK
jgi:hypothetical protein